MNVPTYACVNKKTPPDYQHLQVYDENGNRLDRVIEVDTKEGWAILVKEPLTLIGGEVQTERRVGRFTLAWELGYSPVPTNG